MSAENQQSVSPEVQKLINEAVEERVNEEVDRRLEEFRDDILDRFGDVKGRISGIADRYLSEADAEVLAAEYAMGAVDHIADECDHEEHERVRERFKAFVDACIDEAADSGDDETSGNAHIEPFVNGQGIEGEDGDATDGEGEEANGESAAESDGEGDEDDEGETEWRGVDELSQPEPGDPEFDEAYGHKDRSPWGGS